MNKDRISKIIGFCVAFICLCIGGSEVWATEVLIRDSDTVDLKIEYATGYPGHKPEINVLMKNPVPISSFKIHITLGGWDLINFHTDSIYVDSLWVVVDTCPAETVCTVDTCECGGGEPDTCPCFEWHPFPVRVCSLDTVGSLISDFETISCHGDTGDTNFPDCKWVTIVGIAHVDSAIPPRGNYDLLFKLGLDLFCLCDVDTGRIVYFLISQGFSDFGDPGGYSIPFEYHMGRLDAWWSVPGDANNDSIVDAADILFLINYFFAGGPDPCIAEAADPDSSCNLNSADIVYLINYLFTPGAPAPKRGCFCPEIQPAIRIDEDFELFEEDLNLKPLFERR